MVDSCQRMAKPLQYCKVISLQLKYINIYFKKEKEKTLLLGKTEGRRRSQQSLDGIHQVNGHEFEEAPGNGEGQERQACCSP